MKIGLYGISRSGKDTIISHLVNKHGSKLIHVKGSVTLRKLSLDIYNTDIEYIDSNQLNHLRVLFIEYLNSIDDFEHTIIVDGHYSFPSDNGGFETVFTESDLKAYDVFVYLAPSSNMIISNTIKSPNHQYFKYLQSELNIDSWINFEITNLSKICLDNNKDFIVANGEYKMIESFLSKLIINPEQFLISKIAFKISDKIFNISKKYDFLILLDCDRTVSVDDPTISIANEIGINPSNIKDIFFGDFYTIFQFYNLHEVISNLASLDIINKVASKTIINNLLLEDIKNTGYNVLTIGITSGIGKLWNNINNNIHFCDYLIGFGAGDTDSSIDSYVTPIIKGQIAKLFNTSTYIKAIGDSIIDLNMLMNSQQGYFVVYSYKDKRIQKFIDNNKLINIKQLVYNGDKYIGLEEVKSIW